MQLGGVITYFREARASGNGFLRFPLSSYPKRRKPAPRVRRARARARVHAPHSVARRRIAGRSAERRGGPHKFGRSYRHTVTNAGFPSRVAELRNDGSCDGGSATVTKESCRVLCSRRLGVGSRTSMEMAPTIATSVPGTRGLASWSRRRPKLKRIPEPTSALDLAPFYIPPELRAFGAPARTGEVSPVEQHHALPSSRRSSRNASRFSIASREIASGPISYLQPDPLIPIAPHIVARYAGPYTYANAAPLRYTDPSGAVAPIVVAGAGGGAVVGGTTIAAGGMAVLAGAGLLATCVATDICSDWWNGGPTEPDGGLPRGPNGEPPYFPPLWPLDLTPGPDSGKAPDSRGGESPTCSEDKKPEKPDECAKLAKNVGHCFDCCAANFAGWIPGSNPQKSQECIDACTNSSLPTGPRPWKWP